MSSRLIVEKKNAVEMRNCSQQVNEMKSRLKLEDNEVVMDVSST